MARAAVAAGLALLLLLSPQPGGGVAGPVARIAIFNPVLGEALTVSPSPDGTLALDVHFAVVGPPAEIVKVALVCFETVPGYNLSVAPAATGLPQCVGIHPGRHDVAKISGLAVGPHTLLAGIRWRARDATIASEQDPELARTLFTLVLDRRTAGHSDEAHSSFFLAMARAGGGESSARVLAFLGSELMFRSTGSSNYGSNYPGVWFPTAGICPRSFLERAQGGGGDSSFYDLLHSSAGSLTRLHRALADPDMMFDKRFAIQYQQRELQAHWDWHNTLRPLLKARLRNGLLPFDSTMAKQSYKDVQSERFILHRFSTLSQAVASIRLSRDAWTASGYSALAKELLERGEAAGLAVDAVAAPPRDRLARKDGVCEVNSHAEDLGFAIVGWVRY